MVRTFAAALFVALLSSLPSFAAAPLTASPAGTWQSADGRARVDVAMCGDGTRLCAILAAVSGTARNPGNLKLVNSYVVQGAVQSTPATWHGTVHYDGNAVDGDISLVDRNTIVVKGCQFGMCRSL